MSITPPIIVYDQGDLTIFSSIEAAEKHLEPIDISILEVFDGHAKRLALTSKKIEKKILGIRTIIEVVEIIDTDNNEIDQEKLRKIIISFLLEVGTSQSGRFTNEKWDQLTMEDLVNKASEVAMAR